MKSIAEVIEDTKEIRTVGESNGSKIVTFEQQMDIARYNHQEHRDVGSRDVKDDGTIARSRAPYLSVNLESFYINRFVKKQGKYIVVNDYRAIKDMPTGLIYTKTIPAYQLGVQDGELVLEKMVTISDDEFIAKFTNSLDYDSMEMVLKAIEKGQVEPVREKISIKPEEK